MNREPIVFKSEDSLWQSLKKGTKTWDARVFDISDSRIQRLCAGHWEKEPKPGRKPYYEYDETLVCFLNKDTGEMLQFRYRGIIMTGWAPGWCFIQLGGRVATLDSDGTVVDNGKSG